MITTLTHTRLTYKLIAMVVCAGVPNSAALAMGPQQGANMKINASVETPRLIAVRIHHDMCPFCKELSPAFSKLSRKTNDNSVLFVTLDMSTKATQQQAALLVAALGIECVWTGDLTKLGTVTFIEGKSKNIVSTFSTMDAKTMQVADVTKLNSALRKALTKSRGTH